MLEFRLLGPLVVTVDDRPLSLGGPKVRTLLALLLLRAGDLVGREALVDDLWARPPSRALHALEMRVCALRKRLRAATERPLVITRPGGYLLAADPHEVDVRRFEARLDAGRRALADGRPERADELLTAALAEWHGPVLVDIPDVPVVRREAARLDDLRLGAIEARADTRLALGRHEELVPDLEPLVAEHPFREGMLARLMVALYRCGRQAEALALYGEARARLVRDLGLEPARGLQSLQRAILRHDATLDATLTHLW